MDPDAKNLLRIASRFSYVGIFFGVAIVIGFFSGRWLDARYATQPWLSLLGLFVGIAAGFRELWNLARRGLRDMRSADEHGDDLDDDTTEPPPPPLP